MLRPNLKVLGKESHLITHDARKAWGMAINALKGRESKNN